MNSLDGVDEEDVFSVFDHSAYSGNSQSVNVSWMVKEWLTDWALNLIAKPVSSRERCTKK